MKFCVIDFETTGLSPNFCEIIEFAAVRVENNEIGLNLASLCRPRSGVPRKITSITGITQRMVADYPPFEDSLGLLLNFIGDAVLVAHNIPFDTGFLFKYCREKGIPYSPETFCTLTAARKLYPSLPHHDLGSVAAHLGIENPTAHRALGDAMTTARILIKMIEQTVAENG